MAMDGVPLILDTDIGDDIDDLYALYVAATHPKLDLRAVTTVHGNTLGRARLVEKALRLGGFGDIPVGAGIPRSVARYAQDQVEPAPSPEGAYLGYVTPDDPESTHTYMRATDLILGTLEVASEPTALVGIGAASNLADAVSKADEELRARIRCIALMAGETRRMVAEYNVTCDPEATDYLLNCGLPVFMGGYEVTSRLRLTMDEVAREFGSSPSPACRALADCTLMWGPHRGGKPGPVLYDVVPLFWLADPGLVTTRPSTVRVEVNGRHTRGMTVRVANEGNVLEAVDLDAEALVAECVRTIQRGVPIP